MYFPVGGQAQARGAAADTVPIGLPDRSPARSSTPPLIGGLVLAAGSGRRFGSAKQLASLNGRPLLEHALLAMANACALARTVVVLGANAEAVRAGVRLHGAVAVLCSDWREGQAASLRAGVAALADSVEAIIVTLGDQPAIDPRAIDALAAVRDGTSAAIRASYAGRPGHPVLLERRLFGAVAGLRGDQGARSLLKGAAVRVVACDELGSDLDLDTPEQLALSAGGSNPRR
jgi:CTP:molybdopterin cytidylyltransferase MocA